MGEFIPKKPKFVGLRPIHVYELREKAIALDDLTLYKLTGGQIKSLLLLIADNCLHQGFNGATDADLQIILRTILDRLNDQ